MNKFDDKDLLLAAAEWMCLLAEGETLSEAQCEEYAEWIQSPGAESALSQVESTYSLSAQLRADPEIAELIAQSKTLGDALPRRWNLKRPLALVAAFALAAIGFVVVQKTNVDPIIAPLVIHQTTTGERRAVTLLDGSIVTLNTASEIHVDYSTHQRRIILARGEALFDVQKNTSRPFVVRAGAGEITALGTIFDVRIYGNDSNSVSVALLEGKISVEKTLPDFAQNPNLREPTISKKLLSSGESLMFSDSTMSDVKKIAEISQTAAWKDGTVYFTNAPLADIVAEINRYSVRKIVIQDSSLKDERLNAYFNLDDGSYDSLLFALRENFGVKWYLQSGTTVLYREKSSKK